jgi:hypothetical protein
LALYVGHRPVGDLELASAGKGLGAAERGTLLASLLARDPALLVEVDRDGCLAVRTSDGVPLRFWHYPHPLIGPAGEIDGLAVVSPADLGLMMLDRLVAAGSRRRDLVELYLLCRELPLAELLARAEERPGHAQTAGNDAGEFRRQVLAALDRHRLPDARRLPRLAIEIGWHEVEAWAAGEGQAIGRAPWPATC